MDYPKIDRRSGRDLIDEVKRLAELHTPEWKWVDDRPDIGGALVRAYVRMFEQTIDRLNRSAQNYYYDFLNSFGADLRAPMPERCVVCFASNEGGGGSLLPERFKLIGHSGGEDVIFETETSVFVTGAVLEDIFCADDSADEILHIYENGSFVETVANLQSHSLEITHDFALLVGKNTSISLSMTDGYGKPPETDTLDALADSSKLLWQYKIEDKLFEFRRVGRSGNRLLLSGFDGGFEEDTAINISIKGTLVRGAAPFPVYASRLELGAENSDIVPEAVFSPLKQEDADGFYPFGERFGLLDEMLISCGEAFCKKNARIEIDFYLKYVEFEIENPDNDPKEIEWKYIMKKSELREQPRYDITIEDEVWEYWNGNGFCALRVDVRDTFRFGGDSEYSHKRISFVCPSDMQSVLINSIEGFFIRLRILKVNNLYRTRGRYITPYIKKLRISYRYSGLARDKDVLISNNAETQTSGETERLFFGVGHEKPALYLRFNRPLLGSPINMLVRTKTGGAVNLFKSGAQLYTGEWAGLDCSFSESDGIMSLNVNDKMRELDLFGVSGFWLRCEPGRRISSVFLAGTELIMNAVWAIQRESFDYQYFRPDDSNKIELKKNILEIRLWVEEKDGEYEEWQCVPDFTLSGSGDRHYTVDFASGTVCLGDGMKGMVPPRRERDTVRILYSVGGGHKPVAKGGVDSLYSAWGFINSVQNTDVTSGGAEAELREEAALRHTRFFKHLDRAVTPRDFEALAFEADRSIIKAKCFANTNELAERERGCVSLVLLEKNITVPGASSMFASIKRRTEEYISERASLLKKLYIIEPSFIRLDLRIRIFTQSGVNVFSVKSEIGGVIDGYLKEICNSEEWGIGRLPTVNEINNCIRGIRDISAIQSIDMGYSRKSGDDWLYVDFWDFKQLIFAWAVKANIEIAAV